MQISRHQTAAKETLYHLLEKDKRMIQRRSWVRGGGSGLGGLASLVTTLIAGGEWFVILPILCCGLPLLLLLFFGRRRGGGPPDMR